jgi:hypothetical protein
MSLERVGPVADDATGARAEGELPATTVAKVATIANDRRSIGTSGHLHTPRL